MITDSLWLDEATTALVSQMSLGDIFVKFLPGDFHPPFYYVLMKFWVSFFGSSEISLRTPSVIFAILTIYLIYKMSGKIAAILLSTAPLFFYYAQEARMYMFITFLVTYLVYLFQNKKWFLFSIFLAILGLTDYVALFIIPVFFIVNYKDWQKIFISFSLLVISYLWWFPYFIQQLSGGLSVADSNWGQILGPATLKNFALIPVKFMFGRISFDNKYFYAIVVVILGLIFGYLLYKAKRSLKIYWYWLVLPIVIGILVSFKIPTLTYFRFLFCLPAFYILLADGIKNCGKYSKLFLFIVLGVNFLSTMYFVLSTSFQHEDWRLATQTIGNDQIITPTTGQREALIYYGKKNQIVDLPTAKTVWLSRYVWEIFDPDDTKRLKVQDLGYKKTGEYNFNGVELWKYESRN